MKQAAQELDLPYTTYINYEKNLNEPSGAVLIKLADFYGVTTDYLLGRLAKNGSSPQEDEERRSLKNIIDDMRKSDLKEVKLFLEYLIWKDGQG